MAGAVRCQSGQSKFFLLRFGGAGAWQSCEAADVVPAARESPPQGCVRVRARTWAARE